MLAMTPKNEDIDTAGDGQPLPAPGSDGKSRCPKHGWVLVRSPSENPWCVDCHPPEDPHVRPCGPPPRVFVALSGEQYEATKEALRFAIGDGVHPSSSSYQRTRLGALRAIEEAGMNNPELLVEEVARIGGVRITLVPCGDGFDCWACDEGPAAHRIKFGATAIKAYLCGRCMIDLGFQVSAIAPPDERVTIPRFRYVVEVIVPTKVLQLACATMLVYARTLNKRPRTAGRIRDAVSELRHAWREASKIFLQVLPGASLEDSDPGETSVRCFYCGNMVDEATAKRGKGMLSLIRGCPDEAACIARHDAAVEVTP